MLVAVFTGTCPQFSKVQTSSAMKASSCTHLGGGDGYDLDSCMRATCAHGGNTFNFQPQEKKCYFKRCSGQDFPLTRHTGGYQVFTNLNISKFW